ncbi:MAG: UDP-N-acetylmuramoyl-L-alanine--D-glutamate ligase [Desulfatiglandaceae bacterium]
MMAMTCPYTSHIPTPGAGSRVLVVGLGTSGYWSARHMAHLGSNVTVSEARPEAELDADQLDELQALGVILETGGHREETFIHTDVIVVSPGVPLDMIPLRAARSRHIPMMGELELASRFIHEPIIAVTGTNGKSTVTSLMGHMLENAGFRVFVGGNIGTPLMAYAAQGDRAHYLVVEVSSFQLDTVASFHPVVSILLNISPDHLDRYPDYEAYIASKLRIFINQGEGDYLILNDADPVLSSLSPSSGVSTLRYGLRQKARRNAFVRNGTLTAGLKNRHEERFLIHNFVLPGSHNLENLLGATLAAEALGIGPDIIQKSMDTFRGLPHRLEYVGNIHGISFYNDSKATNVDAAVRAIRSFERPLILIAGGRHKGADYAPLVTAALGRVKGAVFLGEATELLARSFAQKIPFWVAGEMEEAVLKAFSMASKGDAVLLAPACASFDMFSDYAHRGNVFKTCIHGLMASSSASGENVRPESGVVNGG